MANQTQDVELRIRATNYSKKTTDEVVNSLEDLTKAQNDQIKAAKEGAATAADLEKSYSRIESAVKALLSQDAVIKLFQQQSKSLDDLQKKLDAARKAQAEYVQTLDPSTKKTAAQEAQLKKLAKAVADVEKAIGASETRLAGTTQRMGAFGITSENLADKQRQIVSAVTAANAALGKQEDAIESLDAVTSARRAAEQQAAAREQQIRVDNQFAAAEREVARALDATRRAQIESNEAAAMQEKQRLAELDILFSNEQRKAAEAINRQTAALNLQAQALRTAADQAERMVRASAGTARGTTPVQQSNIAATIRDIQDPSAAALRTISGLENSLASLGRRVAEINGPIRNYRDTLRDATEAQAALVAIAGQIDAYNRQIAAVRAARQEYVAARTAVNALIAELRSGAAGEDVTTRLRAAQTVLDRAASSLGNVTTAARTSRAALREAGVDTQNLTAAEAQLVQQANRATTSMNQLTEAYRRNGAAAENAGSRIFSWFGGSNGRTTLSYTQRLRGELLSLAAGFVGVNASIELLRKTLQVYRSTQAITSQLTIANGGDARKAAEDFKYLQVQADRIGFVFQEIAPAFAKFSIAASAAGFNTQQTRFAFEQIAGAAVKARLSTDELTGILKAFEQMASKGKIQAEELRGQLGDRLPGAFQIAARAAGRTVEEYTKLIELGEIGSEQVIAIARELGKTYGAAQAGATTLLQAEARFQNATNRFLNSVAEGGFVDAYQKLLTRLTTLLNDGTAEKFAQQLSRALVALVDVIEIVVNNLGYLKAALIALVAVNIVRWLVSLPVLFRAVATEIALVNTQLVAMQVAMTRTAATGALSTALGASGLTGVLARLATMAGTAGTALLGLVRIFPLVLTAWAAFEAGRAAFGKGDEEAFDTAAPAIRGYLMAEQAALEKADKAREAYEKTRDEKERARLKARYEKLSELAAQAVADRTNAERDAFMAKQAGGTADPGDVGGDAQKLKLLRMQLADDEKKIENQMQQARLNGAKESLKERLKLVDQEYDARRKTANETIKDEKVRADALEAINKTSLKAQAVERQKYFNEQAKQGASEAERRLRLAADIKDKLMAIEADVKDRAAELDVTEPYEVRRKARIDAIGHAYDELTKKIREQAKLDPEAAKNAKVQLDALTKQRQETEGILADRDEANRLLQEFTKLQQIESTNLAVINEQVETGQISIAEGNRRMNEELARLGPSIEAAGEKAREFAMSVQKSLDPVRFAEIMATIGSGLAKSNVTAQTAANNVITAQRLLNSLLEAEQRERAQIQLERQLGLITAEQEVERLNASQVKFASAILAQAQQLQKFIDIARTAGGMSQQQLDELDAKLKQIVTTVQGARQAFTELDKTIVDSIVNNGVNAIDQMAESLAKVVSGQASLSEGFKDAGRAAAQFFAQLLKDLAMAILRTSILKALQSFGGGIGEAAGSMLSAGGMHTGGRVGIQRTFTRKVDPGVFAGAMRYHNGGLPGLKADEVPTILQRGEEVLSKGDKRNIMNGGAAAGGETGGGVRFVLVDDRQRVPEAMQSSAGERVIVETIKTNIPTIRQMLRG